MATQRLYCKRGSHQWQRESQRGKPPKNCTALDCASDVVESDSNVETPETGEAAPTVLGGEALANHLIMNLAARGQLLRQQRESTTGTLVYSGPRY